MVKFELSRLVIAVVVVVAVIAVGSDEARGRSAAVQVRPVDEGVATMLVTKTADTNDGACNADCSLREAIAAVSIGGTITFSAMFDSPQTITLTLGELVIDKSVTITGTGARILTISGNNTSRVINIPNTLGNVNISALTIANGATTNSAGAGIRAFAGNCILTLTGVTIRNNNAAGNSASGGAIITNATLNITGSTISNNTAFQGAGLNLQAGAELNISNSTISGNTAASFGGGVMDNGAVSMILNNVTVTRNSGSMGGGFAGAGAEIRNSIIAGNTATISGPDITGTHTARGNNLIGSNEGSEPSFPAGNPNANGDRVGTSAAPIDPRLTPLQNLGGPTDLHVLLSTSLARNNGNNCVTNLACPTSNPSIALTTDQRGPGFPRLFTNVDIGSYEANNCSFTLSSNTLNVDERANSVSFSITTTTGCAWNAVSTVPWLSILSGGSGTGTGSISFSIQANPSANARTGTITAGDQVFTVNQSGIPVLTILGMSGNEGDSGMTAFNFSVTLSAASAQTVTVNYASAGVLATAGSDFISVSGALTFLPGQTSKVIPVQVIGDTVIEFDENFRVILTDPVNALLGGGGQSGAFILNDDSLASAPYDFDGDDKTDIGIFRTGAGEWWISRSSNAAVFATQFGNLADRITPGDYTGDGKADVAVWRPATGQWFILRSENFSFYAFEFGTSGDVPAPADYDEDGKADPAVFRPASATWYILRSSDAGTTIQQFGTNGDQPVAADYDGDGRSDIAIFRPTSGQWWINRSTGGVTALTFGTSSDKPVQGDYTGDGKADVAFWRPSLGQWYVLRSNDLSYYLVPFGTTGDVPAPGDYDGDGKFDTTVFRPSNATWYSQRTTAGTLIQQFGANGDRPIANAFVP